jgi:hypothetical protein
MTACDAQGKFREGTVGEFAAMERERYLAGCRASIIAAKERRAEAAKRRAAESDFLAAAREGKHRAALAGGARLQSRGVSGAQRGNDYGCLESDLARMSRRV